MQAKPFLKWAGGKTQLINDIEKALPHDFRQQNYTYVEPFVGSGAVLFWILQNYPNIQHAIINDINADLINAYRIIATQPNELIEVLQQLEHEFHTLVNQPEQKKEYYYEKRTAFNSRSTDLATQAGLFIFLNRTCFNGLFRVNKNNAFNVPMGDYKKPTICDAPNLLAVSELLQRVEILNVDYQATLDHVNGDALFYFDPPYKPLSKTSSFNSYAKEEFDDNEQIRLRDFCQHLDQLNHKWILSNSDVRGKDPNDDFFDDLYQAFTINRVHATRMINANADKRGKLTELLITNQPKKDYLPVIKMNIDMFTKFDKPYWVFKEKVNVDDIKIDKSLMSFDNPILNSTLNNIKYYFDEVFWLPITVNKDFYLLDGQHRLTAAKQMNLKYIDVVIQNTELLENNEETKITKKRKQFKL